MCGLAGILRFRETQCDVLADIGRSFASTLRYRGPDAQSWWLDSPDGLVLAHTRLSIIDLSPAGAQPMTSRCGRWVIVYNGEIYNTTEVMAELPGVSWRGHSDTEVLLEACATWGVRGAVPRLIGMFAFALWDKQEKQLYLVRDRLGIKPLYYGWRNGEFCFASELKVLSKQFSLGESDICPRAVDSFIQLSYVPAPLSIFKGVYKLKPGCILRIDKSSQEEWRIWDVRQSAIEGLADRSMTFEDAQGELHNLLLDAVKRQMVADVPLGSFLSGGIDSSLVTALMQSQSNRPIQTFSIGFGDDRYNEAGYASAVAEYLGTEHTQFIVSPDDALNVIPDLPEIFDEPFADSSQIPTLLLSKLARQSVKVALSGDGGDEVFAGYQRYMSLPSLFAKSMRPKWLWIWLGNGVKRVLEKTPTTAMRAAVRAPHYFQCRVRKGIDILTQSDLEEAYFNSVAQWKGLSSRGGGREVWGIEALPHGVDAVSRLRYIDMQSYLPDDILVKLDRTSMRVGMEARVPLLDHRLVELSWRLPSDALVHDGRGKHVLRRILHQYVPERLVERPKMGFGLPLGEWLRGPLRDWAHDLLSNGALSDGFLDKRIIAAAWSEHTAGAGNWGYRLWTVLMLQAWLKRWC